MNTAEMNDRKMMEPPVGARLYTTPTSIAWVDENGILCSVSKKGPQPSVEESKIQLEDFRKHFGDGKFCMLIDITDASPTTKESRDYAAEELPKMVKAIAMISRSALGRMVVNLFFGLKPPPYPTKIFNNVADAKEWLKEYL